MKRIVFTIILFLLLVSGGAIVNVAVAWGCIARADRRNGAQEFFRPVQDDSGWPQPVPDHWPPPFRAYRVSGSGWGEIQLIGATYESQYGDVIRRLHNSAATPEEMDRQSFRRAIVFKSKQFEAGWSVRCLAWRLWMEWVISAKPRGSTRTYVQPDRRPPTAWRSGIPGSPEWPAFNGIHNDWKRLPIRPIWPGFLINTLLYAGIIWLLIPGPFVLRRLMRIKRGRCAKCGYDLRGDLQAGCSECGWNREPEPAG